MRRSSDTISMVLGREENEPRIRLTLMPDLVGHDRHTSAFVVYLFLWKQAKPPSRKALSLRTIADGTGLSKRAVQLAVKRLVKRRLVTARRDHLTATSIYRVERPWKKKKTR